MKPYKNIRTGKFYSTTKANDKAKDTVQGGFLHFFTQNFPVYNCLLAVILLLLHIRHKATSKKKKTYTIL